VVNITFRPLYPRKRNLVAIEWEAGWAPKLVEAFLTREKVVISGGYRIQDSPACILAPEQNKLSGIVMVSVEVFL
jgi:hypothetical protein